MNQLFNRLSFFVVELGTQIS